MDDNGFQVFSSSELEAEGVRQEDLVDPLSPPVQTFQIGDIDKVEVDDLELNCGGSDDIEQQLNGEESDDMVCEFVEEIINNKRQIEDARGQPSPKRIKHVPGTGRPKDGIWNRYIITIKDKKKTAQCKTCGKYVSAKADRLKTHIEKCDNQSILKGMKSKFVSVPGPVSAPDSVSVPGPVSAPSGDIQSISQVSANQTLLKNYFPSMTKETKHMIDKTLAKLIYKKNLAFRLSEEPILHDFCKMLNPSYRPPNRLEIGGKLLDEIYEEKKQEMKQIIGGKKVTIMQDGWSSIQNDPVIVHAASDGRKTVFLSALLAEDNEKTSEYCYTLLDKSMDDAQQQYGVEVIGSCTDNCNGMRKLRRITREHHSSLYVYGCNTHLLNLVGRDLTDEALMKKVVKVQKYFRNHNQESAKLKKLKGLRPILPADTRWNSQIDVFKNYTKNHAAYLQIVREQENVRKHKKKFRKIVAILHDGSVYQDVSRQIQKLEPIAIYLDFLQKETALLADAMHFWLKLEKDLVFDSEEETSAFTERFKIALTDAALVSYMLHPKYKGELLHGEMLERGRSWLVSKSPQYLIIFTNLQTENDEYFPPSLMTADVINEINPTSWWAAVAKSSPNFGPTFYDMVDSLMRLPASTSGLERSLSTMGSIMTKCRANLELAKAKKICFVNFHS